MADRPLSPKAEEVPEKTLCQNVTPSGFSCNSYATRKYIGVDGKFSGKVFCDKMHAHLPTDGKLYKFLSDADEAEVTPEATKKVDVIPEEAKKADVTPEAANKAEVIPEANKAEVIPEDNKAEVTREAEKDNVFKAAESAETKNPKNSGKSGKFPEKTGFKQGINEGKQKGKRIDEHANTRVQQRSKVLNQKREKSSETPKTAEHPEAPEAPKVPEPPKAPKTAEPPKTPKTAEEEMGDSEEPDPKPAAKPRETGKAPQPTSSSNGGSFARMSAGLSSQERVPKKEASKTVAKPAKNAGGGSKRVPHDCNEERDLTDKERAFLKKYYKKGLQIITRNDGNVVVLRNGSSVTTSDFTERFAKLAVLDSKK